MPNSLEKKPLFIHFPKLWTQAGHSANDLIRFDRIEDDSDEWGDYASCGSNFERPENWSPIATEIFAESATLHALPEQLIAKEENTVPSWLWQQQPNRNSPQEETSSKQVFHRVVGAATYNAWKHGMFAHEEQARTFYEESCYALSQRFIAIEPRLLAALGSEWAYGVEKHASTQKGTATNTPTLQISNHEIDALVAGTVVPTVKKKWQKLKVSLDQPRLTVRFTDIEHEWGISTATSQHAAGIINLLSFCQEDGLVNREGLRHAVRLISTLFDLLNQREDQLAFGFTNLAALLLSQGIAYDSKEGRAYAAALTGFITAEAYIISTELAALRGQSPTFIASHDNIMRVLRNHARAAFGDKNDYEKLSVTPEALCLEDCPDLALAASAQQSWDLALKMVQHNGLRTTAPVSLTISNLLQAFVEPFSIGLAPISTLTYLHPTSGEYEPSVIPPVQSCLSLWNLPTAQRQEINQRVLNNESAQTIKDLLPTQKYTLACAHELSPRAMLSMSAALQSLIATPMNATLNIPLAASNDYITALVLEAWRSGLRSIGFIIDPNLPPIPTTQAKTQKFRQVHPSPLPKRTTRHKASIDSVTRHTTAHIRTTSDKNTKR